MGRVEASLRAHGELTEEGKEGEGEEREGGGGAGVGHHGEGEGCRRGAPWGLSLLLWPPALYVCCT
jgi:hypothetical protein